MQICESEQNMVKQPLRTIVYKLSLSPYMPCSAIIIGVGNP